MRRLRVVPLLLLLPLPALLAGPQAAAQLKPDPPAQPAGWKPGSEARAAASGGARIVREFVWGQALEPASGVFRLRAIDRTWGEDPQSRDELGECLARVEVPAEKAEYYVRFKHLRRIGKRRPTMGGVMVNHALFGDTELGGPGLFPRLKAYVAVWGLADVEKNGKVIGRNRSALAWVGQGARGEDGRWLYEADPEQVTAHLVVFGSLGHGAPLQQTRDGFLHFEWPAAKVIAPGFAHDPAKPASTVAAGK
ncbi:MAG: hypothetical protein ACK47B_24500 [Armatimonadota bacterium]